MFYDDKFKDCSPVQTVRKIKKILHHNGICVSEQINDREITNCCSVRITIDGTRTGQNGKGVTPGMALASGYAEFMERLQTGCLYTGMDDSHVRNHGGFQYCPDEMTMTPDTFMQQDYPYFHRFYDKVLGKGHTEADIRSFLKLLTYDSSSFVGKPLTVIPFKNLSTGVDAYFPAAVLRDIYFTNGTCAGNSYYEAMVQGMSEIIERNHNIAALTKCMGLPTIPDNYLEEFPECSQMVKEIRAKTGCSLIIKDCSFETGFPVIAAILISKVTHKSIIKFGAHPVFSIALARSLTEMFQGRTIADAVNGTSCTYDEHYASSVLNLHNCLKNASAAYHINMFGERSDYRFVPFEDRTAMNNEQLYRYMLGLFEQMGYEVYVRDYSFLGFHTYRIIVPGYSELFADGITRMKEKNSYATVGAILRNLGTASEKQWRALHTYLKYKENFVLENTLSFTMGVSLDLSPVWDRLAFIFIRAVCDLHLHDYLSAYDSLRNALQMFPSESGVISCAVEYVRQLEAGISAPKAMENLSIFWSEEDCGKMANYFLEDRLFQTISSLLDESKDGSERIQHTLMAVKKGMERYYLEK